MSPLRNLIAGLRALIRRHQAEQEMNEELRDYLDAAIQDKVRSGMTLEQARRAAKVEMGGMESVKEQIRGAGWEASLESLGQDLRYGLRQLRRNPGFTAVVVLTLALGIGANTGIFSVVEGILLRPLPYKDPGRLLRIYQSNPQHGSSRMMNSPADIRDVGRENTAFEGVTFFRGTDLTLTGLGEAEQVPGANIQGNFFNVLGVRPFLGRVFLPEEQQKGHDQRVILSRSIWQRRFGSDPKILGKAITLDGKPYTVVGVMPSGFHFPPVQAPFTTELWLPWSEPIERGSRDVEAIARLKAGIAPAKSRAEMDTIAKRLEQAYPVDRGWRFDLVPLLDSMVGDVEPAILVIFAAVSFVLLIATANVANLLLARAAGRQREMAVRAAIGASRSRVIRQLLTESVLLALAGGGLGLALAFWGIDLLRQIAPQDIPRLAEIGINRPVLLFMLAASVAVGLLFGIAPALQVSKVSLNTALKEGVTTTVGGFGLRHHRSRNLFVIVQVALSLVLLAGAGLLIKSFLRLTSVPLGFNPENVLTFWVSLSGERYHDAGRRLTFYNQTLERVRALPGVQSAGLTSFLALSGYATTDFTIVGRPAPPKGQGPEAGYKAISPDLFHVLQIPLVQGRYFTQRDGFGAPPVVIVDRAFVQKYFPHQNPLGQRVHLSWGHEPASRQIVGVVGDVKDMTLEAAAPPEFYVPLSQSWITPGLCFVVRTQSNPLSLTSNLRRAVATVDKDQPIALIQTMAELFSNTVAQPRFRTELLSVFSLLALGLTAVGLYGVLSYSVTRRTQEFGIRMALGARRLDLLSSVLAQGLKSALIGVAIGIAAALILTRFLASQLYGVKPTDPLTFIILSLILAAVALLASYLPARRAMKVDPMVALRYE